MHPRVIPQQLLQRLPHRWVLVQRQQQGGVGMALEQLEEAAGDRAQRLAPVLAPVHCGQDHAAGLPIQPWHLAAGGCRGHLQQRVDHGVARGVDLAHHPGSAQVGRRLIGGSKMQLGDLGDQAAVGLLRERIKDVVGAQASLHVAHGNLVVEGGQGCSKGGGGIALHQHQIGPVLGKFQPQALQGRTGHMGQGLLGGHQGQIALGLKAKQRHHLGHHLAVLTGEHDPRFKAR